MAARYTCGMRKLQAMFLTGLLTLLPIWLVWVVFKFVFGLLSDVSRPLIGPLAAGLAARDPRLLGWLAEPWLQTAIALIATVAFVILVGALVRRAVGQKLLAWSERLIARIPLAKTIYGSARQLLDLLQTKPDGTKRVVLIDFPHKEMKSVGFVTRILHDELTGQELAAVSRPPTPNPDSGYLAVVPVDRMTPTD